MATIQVTTHLQMETADFQKKTQPLSSKSFQIVSNGVMIVPPHDFELLSRWYYRVYEKKLFMSILQ
jgi:hypothetical protein